MKLIVGLGNPETKYMKTRHNTGFMVLDKILEKKGLVLGEKFKSFFAKENNTVFLLPKTYMNLSGLAVNEAVKFYKLNIKDILVIYDDVSLPLGTLRFRENGSDGGHNGIKSIIKELNSAEFNRLKVGIGMKPDIIPLEKFVLANFTQDEQKKADFVIETASNAALEWINSDIIKLQSKYNKIHIESTEK